MGNYAFVCRRCLISNLKSKFCDPNELYLHSDIDFCFLTFGEVRKITFSINMEKYSTTD